MGGSTNLLNKKNDSALIRWETCGPEVAWIVSDFENSISVEGDKDTLPKHHKDNEIFQTNSSNDVKDVYHAITGNPFEAEALCAIHNLKPFPLACSSQSERGHCQRWGTGAKLL